MAIKWLEEGVTFNSSPVFNRSVGYEEISRTATQVQIKVTLKLKLHSSSSSAFYGYPIYWKLNNGSAMKIKDSAKWYGGMSYKTYTSIITVPVEAIAGTKTFNINVYATSGGTMSYKKDYSFTYSAFNQPPTFPDDSLKVYNGEQLLVSRPNGTENAVKIPENVSELKLEWSPASDVDNNLLHYEIWHQLNDSTFTRIATTTNTYYIHNIGSGDYTQGQSHDYMVRAVDTYGSYAQIDSTQIQKNILTASSFTTVEGFYYNTEVVNYTHTGGKNTVSSTWFSYELTSPITIYNPKTNSGSIKILESGFDTSETYIKRQDLINYVKDTNYKGNITLTIITRNSYGSSKESSISVPIDLQAPPNPPTKISVSEKLQLGSVGSYIVPNKQRSRLSWEGANDPLGGNLTYDVLYSLDNKATFTTLTTDTPNTSVLMALPHVTEATPIVFRVITKNSSNKTSYKDLEGETLHYYNTPTVSLIDPVRTSISFAVTVITKLNTTIPGVKLGAQDYTGFSGQLKTFSGARVTITDTGLTETSTYTLTIKSSDNTGIGVVYTSIQVSQATPILSVRERGVGIGGVNNSDYMLRVVGDSEITENLKVKNIKSDSAVIKSLQATEGTLETLQSTNGTINNLTSKSLNVERLSNNGSPIQIDGVINHNGTLTISRSGFTTSLNGFELHFNNKIAMAYSGSSTDKLFINYANQFTGGVTIWGHTAYSVDSDLEVIPYERDSIVRDIQHLDMKEALSYYDEELKENVLNQGVYNQALYLGLQQALQRIEKLEKRR